MDENDQLLQPNDLFTRIFNKADNQELFPEIYKLMGLSLVVMVGNVEAERAYSIQNRIKTSARPKLNIDQLDWLIRLRYAEIPVEEFQSRRAAEAYLLQVDRRL